MESPCADLRVLPPALRKRGEILYRQQMWCWGQDIRHPDGNLLLAYGFSRLRKVPDRQGGSSEYLLQGTGIQLRLWSFGLSLTAGHTLVLLRHTFRPKLLTAPLAEDLWKTTQLPPLRSPQTAGEAEVLRSLLQTGCELFGAYEAWIAATQAALYRPACFHRWPERPREPVSDSAQRWRQLALSIRSEPPARLEAPGPRGSG